MKYLFILGRNLELSKFEIESYLFRMGNKVKDSVLIKNGLMIDCENILENNAIDLLGGTIAIGEVLSEFEISGINRNLNKIMIYPGTKNNITYSVWDFSENYSEVLEYLKSRFKEEKLKAGFKGLNEKIKMQQDIEIFKPSAKLIDEEYFIFSWKNLENFGRIIQKSDYEKIENQDMGRPVRRPSLDISQRLAKIMINLSLIKPNSDEKLLDPFCGVGVILSESLTQGNFSIGVDNDEKAIEGAKENLKWSGFNEEKYFLINGDSTKIGLPEFNCIVSEPDLGQVLKKIPTKEKAKKQVQEFEKLIVQVLNNTKKLNSGRVVLSSPYIRVGKKERVSCNIENICSRTGYKNLNEGIPEFREGQIVGRMIWILEKESE